MRTNTIIIAPADVIDTLPYAALHYADYIFEIVEGLQKHLPVFKPVKILSGENDGRKWTKERLYEFLKGLKQNPNEQAMDTIP